MGWQISYPLGGRDAIQMLSEVTASIDYRLREEK